jgi:hypothetical protein
MVGVHGAADAAPDKAWERAYPGHVRRAALFVLQNPGGLPVRSWRAGDAPAGLAAGAFFPGEGIKKPGIGCPAYPAFLV